MAGWNAMPTQSSPADFMDGVTIVYANSFFRRQQGVFSEKAIAAFKRGEAAANALVDALKHDNITANANAFAGDFFCAQQAQDVCAALPASGELLVLIGAKPMDPEIERKRIEAVRKRDPKGNVFMENR